MDIDQIRSAWTEVLYALEKKNRIAWLAFFDARLESLVDTTLLLDFSDSNKFATGHEYSAIRTDHRLALQEAILEVLGCELEIIEK